MLAESSRSQYLLSKIPCLTYVDIYTWCHLKQLWLNYFELSIQINHFSKLNLILILIIGHAILFLKVKTVKNLLVAG